MITVDFNRLSKFNLNRLTGSRILDIGCGTGRHTCAALKFPKVISMGVDINFDDVAEAKKRLELHKKLKNNGGGKYGLSVADICALPFKDNSFDLVICSEVLEHIQDHRAAIFEAVRVLKPGQNLVVSVPRYLPERICWALSDNYHNTGSGHVRIYKKKGLIDLLENAGLTKWGLHFAHSLHAPYWWIKCFVGPERKDCRLVNQYHRFLVWDMMKKPRSTGFLDRLLNPFLGKSIVLYLRKDENKNLS